MDRCRRREGPCMGAIRIQQNRRTSSSERFNHNSFANRRRAKAHAARRSRKLACRRYLRRRPRNTRLGPSAARQRVIRRSCQGALFGRGRAATGGELKERKGRRGEKRIGESEKRGIGE